jgi:hypothetical protein
MSDTVGVVPPERLEPSPGVRGVYVRHPAVSEPWTWRYLWVSQPEEDAR